MRGYLHRGNPLTDSEWSQVNRVARVVGNSTIFRKFIETTGPLGAGTQTVPTDTLIGITEGYRNTTGRESDRVRTGARSSGIVPIISKDFIIHWRDLEEARLTGRPLSMAKVAAAASGCARTEEKFILFGHSPLGFNGLMTVEGRAVMTGLDWGVPGDAFANFTRMTRLLLEKGYTGPYAAVVHPHIYADMHRVLKGSALPEIAHVRAIITSGVFKSSLLPPRSGLVVSTGRQNLELMVSLDTSVAFLGASRMNLPFRVFKAVYLRILRSDAICTF
ncbi:MAG TPA: family 1 encapsulin nanocompartment shell protein [Blastocatellia bacterium]|nr:family 1 encapsulin nanocompartment shell protein [Blastocatellia bacterium]